jgi:hypothetical protein
MRKLVTILQVMCFGLLLMANLYRLSTIVQNDSADMGSVACATDTEEVKNTADAPGFLVEQELHTNATGLPMPEESAAFHIRHTTELPWQHGDTLLLPPEFPSCLS